MGRVGGGAAEVFPAAAGEVLLGAVEPPPFESLYLRESLGAPVSRPVREGFDQPLQLRQGHGARSDTEGFPR